MSTFQLRTQRLGLRAYKSQDLDTFATINADPRVMKHFPASLSREESEALMIRLNQHLADHEFTFWAAELLDTQELIGFIGLVRTKFEAAFTPCVEIGWRLAPQYWGKGLASEGARESLRFGFEQKNLKEIYSFAPNTNHASCKVMQRIGMNFIDTFIHPAIPEEHDLNPLHLYHLSYEDWLQGKD